MMQTVRERVRNRWSRSDGIELLECLVYVAVLSTVLGLAYPAFHRVLKFSRQLQENADDIARTVQVGERWRDDVRAATAVPTQTRNTFCIPQARGLVVYECSVGSIWRTDADGSRVAVLKHVKTARIHPEHRDHVTVWRWEVELETKQEVARMKPLFTFLAVTGGPQP